MDFGFPFLVEDYKSQVMLGTFGYRGFFSDRQCEVLFPDG